MEPVVSYGARIRGRQYDMAIYQDKRGYFLRVYDGRARDIVAPVHLDPAIYGHTGELPWTYATWRGWLRDGAERLLYRVGILRFTVAAEPVPVGPTDASLVRAHTG